VVIFHSYVKLPEGAIFGRFWEDSMTDLADAPIVILSSAHG
jgi:hypothetical protein